MEDGREYVTADLTGMADRYIESQYGDGFTAMFLLGAAGDQSPAWKSRYSIWDRAGKMREYDLGAAGFALAEAMGRRLGEQVVRAAEGIKGGSGEDGLIISEGLVLCPGQKMPKKRPERPVRDYCFQEAEGQKVVVRYLVFGGNALVGVAPELSSATAGEIRRHSPYPQTMVLTMVHGADKYMPEQAAYDRITYEAVNSRFARGAAERLAEAIGKHLEFLYQQNRAGEGEYL